MKLVLFIIKLKTKEKTLRVIEQQITLIKKNITLQEILY